MSADPLDGRDAPRPGLTWLQSLVVAALGVVAIGGGMYLLARPAQPRDASRAPAVADAGVFAVEKAPITLSPARLPALRAMTGPSGREFLADFGLAMQPYRADRFAVAAERLHALSDDYPGVPEAQFYLGVSELLARRGAAAVPPLESALQAGDAWLRPLARWYLALAYHAAGRDAAARDIFDRLCLAGRDPESRACDAARALRPGA